MGKLYNEQLHNLTPTAQFGGHKIKDGIGEACRKFRDVTKKKTLKGNRSLTAILFKLVLNRLCWPSFLL